jgi:hypothetical protein
LLDNVAQLALQEKTFELDEFRTVGSETGFPKHTLLKFAPTLLARGFAVLGKRSARVMFR